MKNIHSTIFLKIFGIITANLLLCDSSQAQDLADFILRNVQKADIIVEGFVESTESFYDNNGEIYTLNYLNCEQVFKEERIGDVGIAIKQWGGTVGATSQIFSHTPSLTNGEKGLFFLTKDKNGIYRLLHGNEGKILKIGNDLYARAFVPFAGKQFLDWQRLVNGVKNLVANETITSLETDFSTKELCYKVDDVSIVDSRTIAANIYIKSNESNTKFAYGEVSIEYPTSVLGTNVVQNSILAVAPSAFISNPNIYSLSTVDVNNDEFKISVGTNCQGSTSYSVLGTTWTKLASVTLTVDAQQLEDLEGNTFITDAKGKYYDQSTVGCNDFRSICLDGDVFVLACADMDVQIVDEAGNPATAAAGIGNIARITGSGFKNSPGVVKIPDADSDTPGGIDIGAGSSELISWSDGLIEIKLSANALPGIMGGGTWEVDPSGFNNSCYDVVDVDFSTFVGTVTDKDENGNEFQVIKSIRRYSTKDLDGAITYYLDNTINNNNSLFAQNLTFAEVETLVKQALCEWESKSGISMKYGGGIAPESHTITNDQLNVIYFTSDAQIQSMTNGNGHDLGVTRLTVNTDPGCREFYNGSPENYFKTYPIVKDSYIAINESKLWYDKNNDPSIENNQYDLYSTLLHEIGHSLGLNHALDSSDNGLNDSKIMYPKLGKNDASNHEVDVSGVNGAMYIAQTSRDLLAVTITAICHDYELGSEKFCATPTFESLQSRAMIDVSKTVSLINQEIFVSNQSDCIANIIISDVSGHILNAFDLLSFQSKPITFSKVGMFFITARSSGQVFTHKIVVQQ